MKFLLVIADKMLIQNISTKCVTGTSLLVSTSAVSCYPASMVNLIWFANERCLLCQQHGDMKSGISWSKNSTFS